MERNQIDYSNIVKKIGQAAAIAARTPNEPEKMLRELIEPLWDEFIKTNRINLVFQPRNERSLANGRPDTVFNRLVLEYKKRGFYKLP